MNLVQQLPPGPLDVVGDIHGEYVALRDLLSHLGYAEDGQHPRGRTLTFVGDFCDRGPNSPAVLDFVRRMIESGRARAVLGNHELNLLCGQAKDGSGWFFDERVERDGPRYAPFERATQEDRITFKRFVSSLPVCLERDDIRVVHAAWIEAAVDTVRQVPVGSVKALYDECEHAIIERSADLKLPDRVATETSAWAHGLESEQHQPPFMHAVAEQDELKQMLNPLKVLTSGVERKGSSPFYSSGKWRFAERAAWWDEYTDDVPVVVGHYWRRLRAVDRASVGKGDPDLFDALAPLSWHGAARNVFCVDFSVGGRWRERRQGKTGSHDFKLAALRWPEREVVFDDGQRFSSVGFGEVGG
jgi:hypothetical protein